MKTLWWLVVCLVVVLALALPALAQAGETCCKDDPRWKWVSGSLYDGHTHGVWVSHLQVRDRATYSLYTCNVPYHTLLRDLADGWVDGCYGKHGLW